MSGLHETVVVMNLWLETRRALAAMDTVMKAWGAGLELNVAEVMVLMLLKQHPGIRCSQLATLTGRQRQNLQVTMQHLELRGAVRPAHMTRALKVQAWALTPAGEDLVAQLAERMHLWERMLGGREVLSQITEGLQRLARALVHHPGGGAGWRRGLAVPEELRRYPDWKDEALKAQVTREVDAARGTPLPRGAGSAVDELPLDDRDAREEPVDVGRELDGDVMFCARFELPRDDEVAIEAAAAPDLEVGNKS
jgi:DNA-binding MarR family transcriptional regulator